MGSQQQVNLGLAEMPVPPGTHICQIYTDDSERNASLLRFLLQGILDGERCASFSDSVKEQQVLDFFRQRGADAEEARRRGMLTLSTIPDVYFKDNKFDPDRMLGLLAAFDEQARAEGFSAARVIGEMSPDVHHIEGGSRLLEYESRVSLLLRTHPMTAVCQYDARAFDGAAVMDVLKVHPMMIVRGAVLRNPFFVPPEEMLGLLAPG